MTLLFDKGKMVPVQWGISSEILDEEVSFYLSRYKYLTWSADRTAGPPKIDLDGYG